MRIRLANIDPTKFRTAVEQITSSRIEGSQDVTMYLNDSVRSLTQSHYGIGLGEQILKPIVTSEVFEAAYYHPATGVCLEFKYGPGAASLAIDGISGDYARLDDFRREICKDLSGCLQY